MTKSGSPRRDLVINLNMEMSIPGVLFQEIMKVQHSWVMNHFLTLGTQKGPSVSEVNRVPEATGTGTHPLPSLPVDAGEMI